MTLEHTDPAQPTLIVCDSYYCVQSFNEYLHYWRQNGFRDSKGNTIKHRLLGGKEADLKETLPNVHVVHTLRHQRVGIHVAGNTLADEAAKSAVTVAAVAAVTRSSMKPDADTWPAVKATSDGMPYPKTFLAKYSYRMGDCLNAEVRIPGVGVRDIPNKDIRPGLIKAVHEGVASAHAGVAATISILQARYWWPGLYKETKRYVLCCDICQQIKVWPQCSADARTVIKDLRVFIGTYAVAAFHSDQSPAFASKAFRDVMALLGKQKAPIGSSGCTSTGAKSKFQADRDGALLGYKSREASVKKLPSDLVFILKFFFTGTNLPVESDLLKPLSGYAMWVSSVEIFTFGLSRFFKMKILRPG
ncbi:hypothetical protein NDU88_005269 [Pleurodeles waltl]|uniref:RNase H type-1 domain-containing protein n=1 Tax=Pleurodeles waltl TaxID=8319 RepID=A0AAV7QIH9_PLEWA|nr:hypothetical protein NDU88_005269 [Pleurodeles waltl]